VSEAFWHELNLLIQQNLISCLDETARWSAIACWKRNVNIWSFVTKQPAIMHKPLAKNNAVLLLLVMKEHVEVRSVCFRFA